MAAEGRCVSSSSLGRRGKLWVSDRPPVRRVSLGQQSTQIQKHRSIHNHRGSLAVTGNGLRPLTRPQPSRPSDREGFQTRARGKLRKN